MSGKSAAPVQGNGGYDIHLSNYLFSELNPTTDNTITGDVPCTYYQHLLNTATSMGLNASCEEGDKLCSSIYENPAFNDDGLFHVCWLGISRALLELMGQLEIKQLLVYSDKGRAAAAHYGDVIMGAIPSQITSHTIVYWTVYSDADQRKHQSSASLTFVWWIHRGLVNSPHKWPVTQKMFPFDDVIMRNKTDTQLRFHEFSAVIG